MDMPNNAADDLNADLGADLDELIYKAKALAVEEIVRWMREEAGATYNGRFTHTHGFSRALTWAADRIADGEPFKTNNSTKKENSNASQS